MFIPKKDMKIIKHNPKSSNIESNIMNNHQKSSKNHETS